MAQQHRTQQDDAGLDASAIAEAARVAGRRAWLQDDPAAFRAGIAAAVQELTRALPGERVAAEAQAAHLRRLRTG